MKKFLIIIISSLLSFFTFAHDNNATDKDQIKDIIKLCEKGPLSSKVDHVKVNEYKENYLKKNFDII